MPKSFNIADIPGPQVASVATPEVMAKLIKAAKSPVLIIGKEALSNGMIDRAIAIANKGIPLIATAHTVKVLKEKGFTPLSGDYGFHELANDLKDPDWKLNGKSFRTVIILGVTYYFASRLLDGLKCFAPHLTIYSIDKYYHPNAKMSFDNMNDKKFAEAVDKLIASL